jgi:hypothetical protein
MTDQTDYTSRWEDYRKRRLWFFGAWLGGLLIAYVLGISLTALLHSELPFPVMGGVWMLSFIVTSLRLSYFRCPRCNEWFFSTFFSHNPFASRCVHCGLPKWQINP